MSKTGVLVARHGPMLANALFLPPGQTASSAPMHTASLMMPTFCGACHCDVSTVSHMARLVLCIIQDVLVAL